MTDDGDTIKKHKFTLHSRDYTLHYASYVYFILDSKALRLSVA